jgi:hypothetical protein
MTEHAIRTTDVSSRNLKSATNKHPRAGKTSRGVAALLRRGVNLQRGLKLWALRTIYRTRTRSVRKTAISVRVELLQIGSRTPSSIFAEGVSSSRCTPKRRALPEVCVGISEVGAFRHLIVVAWREIAI